jgi:hypothetical protein
VEEFLCLLRKKDLKVKGKRLIILRVVTEVEKTHSKTTTLQPKLPTSISTLHFLLESLSLKSNTKGYRNNYPYYHCL